MDNWLRPISQLVDMEYATFDADHMLALVSSVVNGRTAIYRMLLREYSSGRGSLMKDGWRSAKSLCPHWTFWSWSSEIH